MPRWWASILGSGVHGVEFGDRVLHVVGVERDMERDSAFCVEAEEMKKFFLRRTGTGVGSADLESGESQSFPAYGDHLATVSHAADLANLPDLAGPIGR
jgi:hypothetical protein